MYEPLRRRVLELLMVPHEPHPPMGDPASLKVFRAGSNYLKLRLAVWAAAQLLALAAIIFWTVMLIDVEKTTRDQRTIRAKPAPAISASAEPGQATDQSITTVTPRDKTKKQSEKFSDKFADTIKAFANAGNHANKETKGGNRFQNWYAGYKQMLVEIALQLPDWAFSLLWGVKILGFTLYILQIPLTYAVRRLDYELRWYMVTDRSLRLRHGVWKISESTMSFANIQQVVVSQGPVQRLLGLADVKVTSAGGGTAQHEPAENDMHTGLFHSVTNAAEIRDLILDRLRQFRASGLGDPDEQTVVQTTTSKNSSTTVLIAAHEFLVEAKALRESMASN